MYNAYLAPELFINEVKHDIGHCTHECGQLLITQDAYKKSVWSQCEAQNGQIVDIESIGDAVKILRANGKLWAHYSHDHHRRSQLIQEQLPFYKVKKADFLQAPPEAKWGFWTLLEKNKLFYSYETNQSCPLGIVEFNENKSTPPSRAYLKLWELFTFYGIQPQKNQKVVDFGSCPGGWTWVLQQMGCKVISIDKAPLSAHIQKLPNIDFIKTDAFSLKPESLGAIDWFFSDIICYPPKLFELIQLWQEKNPQTHFVCTIKFQGQTDFAIIKKFEKELKAQVVHLYNNKHEVTAIIQPLK